VELCWTAHKHLLVLRIEGQRTRTHLLDRPLAANQLLGLLVLCMLRNPLD
jgi:hypothetical protein